MSPRPAGTIDGAACHDATHSSAMRPYSAAT
jgi:hypothetical protein